MLLLCYPALSLTSAFDLKTNTQEDRSLYFIELLLQRFGDATDDELFWKKAALKEMRSPKKPFVTDPANHSFSDVIFNIQSIVTKRSRKEHLSEKFYNIILSEILDRKMNGTHFTYREDRSRKVQKTISSETFSLQSSSPRTKLPRSSSRRIRFIELEPGSHEITTDEQLSSFIEFTQSDQTDYDSDSTE